jgi:MoxR-like ATPase
LGASPRGGIALLKTARALALLEGREFVIPDDVKTLTPAVLRHRITIAPELEFEGVTADQVLESIVEQVEVPAT